MEVVNVSHPIGDKVANYRRLNVKTKLLLHIQGTRKRKRSGLSPKVVISYQSHEDSTTKECSTSKIRSAV